MHKKNKWTEDISVHLLAYYVPVHPFIKKANFTYDVGFSEKACFVALFIFLLKYYIT